MPNIISFTILIVKDIKKLQYLENLFAELFGSLTKCIIEMFSNIEFATISKVLKLDFHVIYSIPIY